jgi:adenylate cyclase
MLEEMETIVRRHEGILDKYSGDSVMAFWGAPARPVADHERQACLAALEYVERFRALRARCEQEGRTFFEAGIGIHTGEALVGNIGSEHRLNYTAMGDTVNVTSRLEALNRLYGTRILISETTYDRVAAEFETRLIDTVIVKGRRKPTRLYELLSRKGQLSDLQRRLGALYVEGLEQYQRGNWDTALERFEAGLALVPDDGPCLALRARCLQYRQAPPAEDWNGVYVSTSK